MIIDLYTNGSAEADAEVDAKTRQGPPRVLIRVCDTSGHVFREIGLRWSQGAYRCHTQQIRKFTEWWRRTIMNAVNGK